MMKELADQPTDLKHWLWQILPPMLILVVLVLTASGTNLLFAAVIFILPMLISIISLVVKLVRYKTHKHRLLRPALTILFFAILILAARSSYQTALNETVEAAKLIHGVCNQQMSCPIIPNGWQRNETSVTKKVGWIYNYLATYHVTEDGFYIYLYWGPDTGNYIRGGVGKELTSEVRSN